MMNTLTSYDETGGPLAKYSTNRLRTKLSTVSDSSAGKADPGGGALLQFASGAIITYVKC